MARSDERGTGGPEPGISKTRIGGLIDAVYAIAMTLLVVTLELPDIHGKTSGQPPLSIIQGLLPDFLHYFAAFLILAGFWYLHHQRFLCIRSIDRKILAVNLVSLLFISLVPFTTNIAGNYPQDPIVSVLFSLDILVIGLISVWEWYHIRHNPHLMDPHPDRQVMQFEESAILVIPILSVCAIIVAVLGIPFSVVLYFLIVPVIAWLYWREVSVPGIESDDGKRNNPKS